MNDIEQKRQAIAAVYRSFSWATKVKAMTDNQVIAVYLRFKQSGKI